MKLQVIFVPNLKISCVPNPRINSDTPRLSFAALGIESHLLLVAK